MDGPVKLVDRGERSLLRITKLAHHGFRSVVQFLGKLRLNLIYQKEVADRLFTHHPWMLERLYISHLKVRYSQQQGHFPNVFLVDGQVNETRIPGIEHRHTYWLKYLLLKRISTVPETVGISAQALLDEFATEYGFEEDIIRLCLGSLAMVNESRCIEILGAAKDSCLQNPVRLTSRGKVLIGVDPEFPGEYCFEWSYLQMLIDDHLMLLPTNRVGTIAVGGDLSYALTKSAVYGVKVKSNLLHTLRATIAFLGVLSSSWKNECIRNKKLEDSNLGPDFERVISKFRNTIARVCTQSGIPFESFDASLALVGSESDLDEHLREYELAAAAIKRSRISD